MGKPSWGWVVGGFILFIMGLGQVGREFATYVSSSTDPGDIAGLLGGMTGLWLGLFFFYRVLTRKRAKVRYWSFK